MLGPILSFIILTFQVFLRFYNLDLFTPLLMLAERGRLRRSSVERDLHPGLYLGSLPLLRLYYL